MVHTVGKVVVICTEHADNRGDSISGAAGLIAAQICEKFHMTAEKLVLIENNPLDGSQGMPQWKLVIFKIVRRCGYVHFQEKLRRPMSSEDWSLLGLSERK